MNEDSLSYLAQISKLEEKMSSMKKQNNGHVQEIIVLGSQLQSETQNDEFSAEIQKLEAILQKLKKRSFEIEVQCDDSTPENGTTGSKFASLQDELVKLQHQNHNLSMQMITGVQQLQKAETAVQNLHQALLISQVENGTLIFQYQQSLKMYEAAENRAKNLQARMPLLQEENQRIKDDMAALVQHIKIIEEKANGFDREKDAFQQSANSLQAGFITKHDREQNHSLTTKFQLGNERMKGANQRIAEEICCFQQENDKLMERSLSAEMSVKNLEKEVYSLERDKANLLNEVAFRVDQRDALQQELYCLQEERNDLDRRFQKIMKQINSMGLDAESIQSFLFCLQNVSQKLREHYQISEEENFMVPQFEQKIEELIEKNLTLEKAVLSHHLEIERIKFKMKLLQQHIQELQKEKAAVMVKFEQHKEQAKTLDAKLQTSRNLYSQIQGEHQQLKGKLTNMHGLTEHLEEQVCNLQRDKKELENEIAERVTQASYSQKQAQILQEERKDLMDKLREEAEKQQVLENEIVKLRKLQCQMDHRKITLSDNCNKNTEKYSIAEEKVMELEKTNLMQQAENDILLLYLLSGVDCNRDLELEIDKLQHLLAISNNVQVQSGIVDMKGTKLFSIVEEVKRLHKELSHFQKENEKLIDNVPAKSTIVEKLKNDIFVLCSEEESVKEKDKIRFEDMVNLQKQMLRLQETAEALRIKLEARMARERNLGSEMKDLQEYLPKTHLELEGDYQRALEKHNSTKEAQSGPSEMKQENKTPLTSPLAQIILVTMLEHHIVQKDEKLQLLEEQLYSLQVKNAKLENELQSCATEAPLQNVESQQLQESICSFHEDKQQTGGLQNELKRFHEEQKQQIGVEQVKENDKNLGGHGQRLEAVQETNERLVAVFPSLRQVYSEVQMTGKNIQEQISMWTEESLHLKWKKTDGFEVRVKLEDALHGFQGEKRIPCDKLSSSSRQANKLHGEMNQLKGEGGSSIKQKVHGQMLDVEVERLCKSLHSCQLTKTLLEDGNGKHGDKSNKLETRTCKFEEKGVSIENEKVKQGMEETSKASRMKGPEVMVSDLEAENKITGGKASAIFTASLEEDICALKEQNAELVARLEARETNMLNFQEHLLFWQF
eukprot:Gb_01777 [translate_table: standard]